MKNDCFSTEKIERLLSQKRQNDVPEWMAERIMDRVVARPPSLLHLLRSITFFPVRSFYKPAQFLASVILLICGFWVGYSVKEPVDSPDQNPIHAHLIRQVADPTANHLLGRGFLEAGHFDLSLEFLQKAAELEPGIAEYRYWLGVAHWKAGDVFRERESYLHSVNIKGDYLPSLVNLGHSYLDNGDYKKALLYYEKALQVDAREPRALYNKALTLRLSGETAGAKEAFHSYLDGYRRGKWAYRAVEHLHRLEDYSYRNYLIGTDSVIVNIRNLLGDGISRSREIAVLARAAKRAAGTELHLVMFVRGDERKAKSEVRRLKRDLLETLGKGTVPIRVSWFNEAEKLELQTGRVVYQDSGLLVFTRSLESHYKRSST